MLRLTKEGAVAELRLDRPPVNAFNAELVDELATTIDNCVADPDLAVLLVGSTNAKILSAGADIGMLEAAARSEEGVDRLMRFVETFQIALEKLEACRLMTVAVIPGLALGGGLELALACDFRVVSSGSKLGLTETNLGLIPGAGGTQRLTRVVGRQKAKWLILSGQVVSGDEATAIGLADVVHPDAQTGALELARSLADRPRKALQIAKECVDLAPSGAGYERERTGSRELYTDEETQRLLGDFLRRR